MITIEFNNVSEKTQRKIKNALKVSGLFVLFIGGVITWLLTLFTLLDGHHWIMAVLWALGIIGTVVGTITYIETE